MKKWAAALSVVVLAVIIGWRTHYDSGWRPHYDAVGAHYDRRTHYDAPIGGELLLDLPLSSNGVTGVSDLPSGFPAPEIAWFGWDPTTNNGTAGGTFAASGATTAVETPFCPDGDHTNLSDSGDPASTSCAEGRYFDGVNDYYTLSGGTWNGSISSGSLSVCAVFNPLGSAGTARTIAGNRDSGDNDGWWFIYNDAGINGVGSAIETDAPAAFGEYQTGVFFGGWAIACGSYNHAGNVVTYRNALTNPGTAYPAGDSTSSDDFLIGWDRVGGGNSRFHGNLLAVYVWDDVALSASQVNELSYHWMGILPSSGALAGDVPTTATTGGNTWCWVDGELEGYADDWVGMIGCEVPPGLTGAGADGGMLTAESLTNNAIRSNDFTAGWTEVGTCIGAASATNTPFRDGVTTVTPIEDDSAVAAEYVHQTIDSSSLNTGDDFTVVLYARSDSGTKGLDVRVSEQTGGACAASDNDFAAQAITATWSTLVFNYDYADGDCTEAVLQIGPVSDAGDSMFDVAETGVAYFIVQVFFNVLYAPAIYVATAATTAVGGDVEFRWLNDSDFEALQASASDRDVYEIDFTPTNAKPAEGSGTKRVWYVGDGTGIVYHSMILSTVDQKPNWITNGGANSTIFLAGVTTPGTTVNIKMDMDWGKDVYKIYRDDVLQETDTAADSPPAGMDTLVVGGVIGGTAQPTSAFIKNIKIERQ